MTAPPVGRPVSLRRLRQLVIAATAGGAVMVGLLVPMLGFAPAEWVWLAVPIVVSVVVGALLHAIGSSTRPLAPSTTEEKAREVSPSVLRTVTFVRLGTAAAPLMFGIWAGSAADSGLPVAVGLALWVVLILAFVYPRHALVDTLRQRLEADGARSWLWEALAKPAPR